MTSFSDFSTSRDRENKERLRILGHILQKAGFKVKPRLDAREPCLYLAKPELEHMDDLEFGGIDEVAFDISSIRALQEDEDALQERARKNVGAGIWSFEEGRLATGMDPAPAEGTFFIPSNLVPTPIERLGAEKPELSAPEPAPEEPMPMAVVLRDAMRAIEQPKAGRPKLLADPGARATYDKALALRAKNPSWSWLEVADKLGISERQLRRYRAEFE